MTSSRADQQSRHERPCETCGQMFKAFPSDKYRFCSKSCALKARVYPPLEERFWAKVTKTEGCWLWTGSTGEWGYGKFNVSRRTRTATRGAWEFTYGPIPEGKQVLHHCDTPACVRPDHLFLGTHDDNQEDKGRKGRAPGKLTEQDRLDIKAAMAAGIPQNLLALKYEVHQTTIGRVLHPRERWRQ